MNNSMQSMQQHGKTFALAAKLLTPSSRNSAAGLYAFARFVDDMMDLNATNAAAKKHLIGIQHDLKNISSKNISSEFAALQNIIQQHNINPKIVHVFLQAQQYDEDGRQFLSERELIDYAYGVAGTIGQMMRPILGAPQTADIYAVSLGIAMQLTNIARDVIEDANRSRIYIPATFFSTEMSLQTLLKPSAQQAITIFIAIEKLLALADSYYEFSKAGYHYIPLRNRLSIAAAAAMYRGIGSKILQRGSLKYWHKRVSLGLLRKIFIALSAVIITFVHAIWHAQIKPQNHISTKYEKVFNVLINVLKKFNN